MPNDNFNKQQKTATKLPARIDAYCICLVESANNQNANDIFQQKSKETEIKIIVRLYFENQNKNRKNRQKHKATRIT